jgi:hypothetical protein
MENDRTVALLILCPLIAAKEDLVMFGCSPRQWFRKQEPLPDRGMTCAVAPGSGHLKLLQWSQYNGFVWNASTCRAATHFAQLDVLEWRHNSDCPCDDDEDDDDITFATAKEQEECSVLKWCRENECPWDEMACAEAVSSVTQISSKQ